MNRRNDGTGAENTCQNQFTAYLVTAIKRRREKYLIAVNRIQKLENRLNTYERTEYCQGDNDILDKLPLMDQIENHTLKYSLERIKERNLRIFLARAIDNKSFTEIADEMQLSYRSVVLAWYNISCIENHAVSRFGCRKEQI